MKPYNVIQALTYLSSCCDGASKKDGAGFNKLDSNFGKNLASKAQNRGLTKTEFIAANKMLQKYTRQLQTAGIEL